MEKIKNEINSIERIKHTIQELSNVKVTKESVNDCESFLNDLLKKYRIDIDEDEHTILLREITEKVSKLDEDSNKYTTPDIIALVREADLILKDQGLFDDLKKDVEEAFTNEFNGYLKELDTKLALPPVMNYDKRDKIFFFYLSLDTIIKKITDFYSTVEPLYVNSLNTITENILVTEAIIFIHDPAYTGPGGGNAHTAETPQAIVLTINNIKEILKNTAERMIYKTISGDKHGVKTCNTTVCIDLLNKKNVICISNIDAAKRAITSFVPKIRAKLVADFPSILKKKKIDRIQKWGSFLSIKKRVILAFRYKTNIAHLNIVLEKLEERLTQLKKELQNLQKSAKLNTAVPFIIRQLTEMNKYDIELFNNLVNYGIDIDTIILIFLAKNREDIQKILLEKEIGTGYNLLNIMRLKKMSAERKFLDNYKIDNRIKLVLLLKKFDLY